ncbi:MAG: tRNA lysidine(34) synthetase TilS, partial [Actinomyces sp.]|nr:tRNA lysidine(34) synthetase TilS [Actinomyces sp.]
MCADASSLVGANPRGPLRACSLAVRASLTSFIDEAGAPPALVVGLSGGADSLALALTTIDVAARAGIPVVTVTVDHGLRAGSGEEARRVADLAASLGARAVVETVAVDGPGGPEGAARDARRAALRAVAQREGAPILLGHTMDDQAETVLLRLARGSGPSSLRAIAPVSRDDDGVTWLRPLLGLRRTDTEQACAQAGLAPVEDPTNDIDGPWRAADGSPLRRSALRHRAIP